MITVYAKQDSPRLRYILRWMLGEILGTPFTITANPKANAHLSYGLAQEAAVFIPDEGLLWQSGLSSFSIPLEEPTGSGHDILSAAFYLLSRMEEWVPFTPGAHGRFPAAASCLFPVLRHPVVDHWIENLRCALNSRFSLAIPKPPFRFQPTYDIDIAWAYHHKGFKRSVGGVLRDLKQRSFVAVRERLRVLQGLEPDPLQAYRFLRRLHAENKLSPRYFVLATGRPGPFDKNADRNHPAMRALVQEFAMEGTVGIHPSYHSSEHPALIREEKTWMEGITGRSVVHSRQHYIRLRLPHTYRELLAACITGDWSMGYPEATGFRAGTARPFPWYDIEAEAETALRIHPFCFMDVTARDYLGLSVDAAFKDLREMTAVLQDLGAPLTTVFHNFSLGTARDWPGWREGYESFVKN